VTDLHPPLSPFWTGLRARCPRCGEAPLFDGFLTVRERCPGCGLDHTAHDSGDGPAVFIIFVLGFIIVPLALWLERAVEPPMWVHMVIWFTAVLGGTFALLLPFKATMVALQFKYRSPQS
jgi:uncharacterized protein (DUF983 family)